MDIEIEDTNGINLLDSPRVISHEKLLDSNLDDAHALILVELHIQPVPIRC
jgi:hypothetical protein